MMNFLKHFSKGELGLGRIEAFSDGVFAPTANDGIGWSQIAQSVESAVRNLAPQ